MTESVILEVSTEWFSEEANFKPCDGCGDVMITASNGLYLFVGFDLLDLKPSIVLCNSCCPGENKSKEP